MLYGAAAGCGGTLVITLLGRMAVGVKTAWEKKNSGPPEHLPRDPFNPQQVTEWQDHSRAPAAYSAPATAAAPAKNPSGQHAAEITPAGALAQTKGPGPEGAAEEFLVKLGSGLFDRDLSIYSHVAGKVLHFAYGSVWGIGYGMAQGRRRRNVIVAGPIQGAITWFVGPVMLVPAMRLMPPPWESPKHQTALVLAGHMIYGVALAKLFDVMVWGRK